MTQDELDHADTQRSQHDKDEANTKPAHAVGYAWRATFDGLMLDITKPNQPVEISIRSDGTVLWVNVGVTCVLRICQMHEGLELEDARPIIKLNQDPDIKGFGSFLKDHNCNLCSCKDYDGLKTDQGNWTRCNCGHIAQDHS